MKTTPTQGSARENSKGQWVPVIPEPYFYLFIGMQCDCGKKFLTFRRYREHYAFEHIYK